LPQKQNKEKPLSEIAKGSFMCCPSQYVFIAEAEEEMWPEGTCPAWFIFKIISTHKLAYVTSRAYPNFNCQVYQ
jgi:hypothetical protein